MHFTNLDAYFHMASHGDPEAYDLLYKEFVYKAKSVTTFAGFNLAKYSGIMGDFTDLVDYLFFRVLNEYEREKGPFGHYVDYCLNVRLIPKVNTLLCDWIASQLDMELDEAEIVQNGIEIRETRNYELRTEIELKNFKMSIASPGSTTTKDQKLCKKLMLMVYAGFKATEIKKMLNINESQYRAAMRMLKENDELLNLKLELK